MDFDQWFEREYGGVTMVALAAPHIRACFLKCWKAAQKQIVQEKEANPEVKNARGFIGGILRGKKEANP